MTKQNTKGVNTGIWQTPSVVCASALLLLSGCGFVSLPSFPTKHASSNPSSDSSSVRREKLVTDIGVNDARDIAQPVSLSGDFSTDAPTTSIGTDKGGAMSPPRVHASMQPKGLMVGPLFEEKIRSDDKRFDRLEGSVQDIHTHLASISPSIERLVAIEGDIQNLVTQLEVLLKDPTPTPAPSAKRATSVAAKSHYKAPVNKGNYGPDSLVNVRGSESAGKTRIVFEMSGKLAVSHDVDNDAGILAFTFPDAVSANLSSGSLKRLKLVSDVSVTPQGGKGYVVALSLTREASVVSRGGISPNRDSSMHRVYFDLK